MFRTKYRKTYNFFSNIIIKSCYQVLLIIHLKLTAKSVKGVKKEIKSNHYAILLDLKIINFLINAKIVKKDS